MEGLFKLSINGIDTALKFTMWCIERLNKIEAGDGLLSPAAALVYAGLDTYYRHLKQDNPFTQEDIELWCDEQTATDEGYALLESMNKAFEESSVYRKLKEAADDKKKSSGKTSTPSPSESLG